MRAMVLTGRPGVGKTAALAALVELLEAEDVAHAAIEVEALAVAYPWPERGIAFDHTRLLADSFRRHRYPLLLVSATVEDADYLRRLLDALATDDLVLVRLAAPPDVLRERIIRREPADWVGLPRLLDAAQALARSILELPGVDLVVSTEENDPRAVAAAIRARLLPR